MFGRRKKGKSKISYFSASITKPSGQAKMEEGEIKEVRQRRWRWRRGNG